MRFQLLARFSCHAYPHKRHCGLWTHGSSPHPGQIHLSYSFCNHKIVAINFFFRKVVGRKVDLRVPM